MLVIPFSQLSLDALQGVLEEYASREGTEYGYQDIPMDTKVSQLKTQLDKGSACIVFDEETGSCNLMLKQDLGSIVI